MPALHIRPARGVDAEPVQALVAAAYARYLPRMDRLPAPLTADHATLASSGALRVAVRADRIVGALVTRPHPDHLLIENLAVDPGAQGTGVGAALLAEAEREARRLDVPSIRLYTNAAMTEAIAYYPRHGFVETHRAIEQGFRRVFFERRLHPGEPAGLPLARCAG